MITEINNRSYEASEGMTFVRKSDNVRFGHFIYLSVIDSIDNYIEEPMTEEEIKELEEFNNRQSVKLKIESMNKYFKHCGKII